MKITESKTHVLTTNGLLQQQQQQLTDIDRQNNKSLKALCKMQQSTISLHIGLLFINKKSIEFKERGNILDLYALKFEVKMVIFVLLC